MGFYATETAYPPSENRVGDFFASSPDRVGKNDDFAPCSRLENRPTPTATASGVAYYGFRYYSTELGRWVNRDPITEIGFQMTRRQMAKHRTRVMAVPTSPPSLRLSLPKEVVQGLRPLLSRSPEPSPKRLNEERNVYGFVKNNPINKYDLLGLVTVADCYSFWADDKAHCDSLPNFADVVLCYEQAAAQFAGCLTLAAASGVIGTQSSVHAVFLLL